METSRAQNPNSGMVGIGFTTWFMFYEHKTIRNELFKVHLFFWCDRPLAPSMPPVNPQMVILNCWVGWPHDIEIFKGYQTQFRMFIIMFSIKKATHLGMPRPSKYPLMFYPIVLVILPFLGHLGGVDHHPISDLHLFAGAEYRFAPRMARLSGASDTLASTKSQTSTT